ncbi:MAG: hypothetical protein AAF985_19350 [Bacteroidota bacterium]
MKKQQVKQPLLQWKNGAIDTQQLGRLKGGQSDHIGTQDILDV